VNVIAVPRGAEARKGEKMPLGTLRIQRVRRVASPADVRE
jgi:hypothetical protein